MLQGVELGQLYDDGNFMHTGIQFRRQGRFFLHLDRRRDFCGAGLGDVILTQIGVLVHFQVGVGGVTDGKTRISAGQAMFVDVQAVDFFLFGNAQANGLFDDGKDDEHGNQHPDQHAGQTQQLYAEEGEAVTVETAPTGSSILATLSKNSTENTQSTPATMPMMAAPKGSTISQPAVMATRPASAPLKVRDTSGLP